MLATGFVFGEVRIVSEPPGYTIQFVTRVVEKSDKKAEAQEVEGNGYKVGTLASREIIGAFLFTNKHSSTIFYHYLIAIVSTRYQHICENRI